MTNDSEQQSGGVEPAPIESVGAESATTPVESALGKRNTPSGRSGGRLAGVIAAGVALGVAGLIALTVAVVALLGLVGTAAWLLHENQQANALDEQRNEFIEAAKVSATNLTSIHVDTAKDDVQRILDNATGEFKEEFDGRVDPFVSVVTEAKVNTDGDVLEAGLESEAGDTGTVLVAVRSLVTNAGTAQPQPRDFRLRITVVEEGDRMLTSKVEFVA